MKINNHILVIISILSLFFVVLIEGNEVDEIYDEVNNEFGRKLDEAADKLGPLSSSDLEQLEEAKDAFGPIPSFEEATEALSPSSSSLLKKAKEALGPISPSTIDDAQEALGPISPAALEKAKEALGPISPSTIEDAKKALGPASSKAKETLGPSSSGVIDKAKEKIDSIASWITQNKEDTSSEDQNAPTPSSPNASPLDPYGVLDGAKEKFDSLLDDITEEKEQISPSLAEEAQKESSPLSSKDNDEAQNKMGPSSAPSPDSSKESDLSKIIDKAKSIFNNKEEISSESPSISVKAPNEQGPMSSVNEDVSSMTSVPASGPVLPSTLEEAKDAIGSYSSKAMDAAKEKFSTISSYLSQNKLQKPPGSDIKLHSTPVYLDHDDALAVESLIKQAQTNTQLAMDEAKTIVSDPTIDPSGTAKCVDKCMAHYGSCDKKLNKALDDLKSRNVEVLKDDITEVEGEIQACQKCFLANTKMQSMFKDLEDATIKATRECLNVIDHSG
ncbi:putative invertase/pectin methylesterase inhibitor domain superfamily [Helianthus annuus]|nr:putative invertase/pectin methylesterase inhibitor domain superfamily [Helianthus annuus]